ncbi:MAG: hypothetical protein NTV87_05055, partial [Ignavibacteriae bacterium]|nr:hypothetical protein [Ignavibacteriota bacterium]
REENRRKEIRTREERTQERDRKERRRYQLVISDLDISGNLLRKSVIYINPGKSPGFFYIRFLLT